MTIYYVDQTTGDDADTGLTEALAWKTIAKVNAATFAGDDSCLFKCGEVWRETLIPHDSGTTGHPITYGSYGTGDKPLISGADVGAPTTPVRDQCVEIGTVGATKEYLTFDGLELAYPKLFGLTQLKDGNTPGITVQNCTFTKCGLDLQGATTIIQDNTFVGPSPRTDLQDAAIIIHKSTAVGCSVLRNTISGWYSRGIWFTNYVDKPTANDNIVYDIDYTGGTTDEGFGIDFDGYGTAITGKVTALRNTIYDCARWGVFLENCSDGSDISCNIIHGCPNAAIMIQNTDAEVGNDIGAKLSYNILYENADGITIEDVSGVDTWNNVVDAAIEGFTCGVQLVGTPANIVDVDIRNNIFGSGLSVVVRVPGDDWTDNLIAFDYNCVEDIIIIYENVGAVSLSLADLQAAGKALHCFTTAPGFVDAANHNYHLLSTSPCINTGVDVGLTEDIEGNPIE